MNACPPTVGTPYYSPRQDSTSHRNESPQPFESASSGVFFSQANQSTETSGNMQLLRRIDDHPSTSDRINWSQKMRNRPFERGKETRPLPPEVEQLLKLRHYMKRHKFENLQKALLRTPTPARQPSFLLNLLPTELIEVIFANVFASYLEDRKEDWDRGDFRESLRVAFLTCSRIRSILVNDRRLWPFIFAVISSRDLKTERFTPLLETCAALSCNRLDYIDLSAFGRKTVACWTTFNRWLLVLMQSAYHIKVFKAPMQFRRKQRCRCKACKSIEYLEDELCCAPIDPRSICLMDLIVSKASRLDDVSLRILEMPRAFSHHLRSSEGFVPAPRNVNLIVDVGTPPSASLSIFYSKLCRRSKKMTIQLGDHFGSSDSVRDEDRRYLTNAIVQSASSTLQQLTIRNSGPVDRLLFPACLPKLDYLRLSTARDRPSIDIDSPSSKCKLPSLRTGIVPISALQWMQAPNVAVAQLCLDEALDEQWDADRMIHTLSQWVRLAYLLLIVPKYAPQSATIAVELVVQGLTKSSRTRRRTKLENLQSYHSNGISTWSMRSP